jgi:tetratricopeptide (TPR) repeat protein
VAVPRTPDALDQLARRADPADAGAQNNLGVLLHKRGRPEAARAAFARALALDPAMTLARRNLAQLGAGDAPARREAALRVRLRADGADHEARRELALLLAAQRRGDAARAECAAWRALAPDDAAPWVTLAHVEHEAGGAPEAAVAALEQALRRAPGSATVRTQLAEVHYRRATRRAPSPCSTRRWRARPTTPTRTCCAPSCSASSDATPTRTPHAGARWP